jgi:hypothetical protein
MISYREINLLSKLDVKILEIAISSIALSNR